MPASKGIVVGGGALGADIAAVFVDVGTMALALLRDPA